jgi:hypothetical protein
MKKRKNKIPSFIPNQPSAGYFGIEKGIRNELELRKQRENQKKLMLNNKNNKY